MDSLVLPAQGNGYQETPETPGVLQTGNSFLRSAVAAALQNEFVCIEIKC